MARSAAAIVHGFATFDPELRVAGVIFNRVGSDHHEQLLREAVAPLGIPVLGALRRDERVVAPERHLGLVPAGEREPRTRVALDTLAGAVERYVDVPRSSGWRGRRRAPAHGPGLERRIRRPSRRAARASRSPAGPRSRFTTRRTSSCSRPRAPSSPASTRCATRRCRPTAAR